MYQNNTAAIYSNKKHEALARYVQQHHSHVISLYDSIESDIVYNLSRFHYTEINNAGYCVYIDDLRLFDRLQGKNNTIIYYLTDSSDHNMNYNKIYSLIGSVDAILLHNNKIEKELIKTVFNYTKELLYV